MNLYQTAESAQIYQIEINEFPRLTGNVYLVIEGEYRVLIDTGSGFGDSHRELELGLEEISDLRGENCRLDAIKYIFITHGHIDHYGGLSLIKKQSNAKICIHELDKKIVSDHLERLTIASHRLEEFLIEAGVESDLLRNLIEMYKMTKIVFQSVSVDITYESIGMKLGPFKFTHVPGHCAGHVVIQLHDVLFSGDHILEKTSPHQAPEQITLSTGLDTYLNSLELLRPITKQVKYTLGGHEGPIIYLEDRIEEIRSVHFERLQTTLDFLTEPHTIFDISKFLFGIVDGYTILLALEETGAHVEYLYQRGFLKIVNIKDIEKSPRSVPILYQCIDCRIKTMLI